MQSETSLITDVRVIRHGHLFCGLGGGARGFNRASPRVANMAGRFECVGGVDFDAAAIKDFERLSGVKGTLLDLFDREQYIAFHGHEPPGDWRQAMPADIHKAFGYRKPHIIFLSPPCLPADGLVITDSGSRRIDSIRAGDKVLTHKGRLRHVTHVGTHRYTGMMNGFRLNGTVDRQWFTDEHPLWVRRVIRNEATGKKRTLGKVEFRQAKDVRAGDRIGFPIEPERRGTASDFVASFGNPQHAQRGGFAVGNYPYAKAAHTATLTRTIDLSSFAADVNLWFLLGCYLGDGYRHRGEGRYEVIFCVGPDDGCCARQVREALDVLGVPYSTDRDGGITNVKVRARSKHLHMVCAAFGDGAENKHIPEVLFGLEDLLVASLLDGYRETDGSEQMRRKTTAGVILQARWKIPSVSLQLLRDFQRILLRQGTFASIHKCWPGGPQVILGRAVQTKPRWELNVRLDAVKRTVFEFADGAVWVRVRDVLREQRDERVWNLSVDEDDTFCAPMMATHNCKGYSGLLSEGRSKTEKYQALNRLALRGVWLALEAYADDPVELLILENVPRIATRGRKFLDQIEALLSAYGYISRETSHDCGELGGLSQSRKRFLLVARHKAKVPNLLFSPPKRRLRGVGDVLGRMPMPGDERAGPMHRVPSLQWQTWVRLAFVRAGSDWRSLNDLQVEDGHLRDYLIVPEMRAGVLGVRSWDQPSYTVAGRSSPTNNAYSVADPRYTASAAWKDGNSYGVNDWDQPSATIAGQQSPGQGRYAVADPRVTGSDYHGAGVRRWDEPTGTITGQRSPMQGGFSVADPRHDGPRKFSNCFRIIKWDRPGVTVTGAMGSMQCVADPRPTNNRQFDNIYKVAEWDKPSGTIIGRAQPSDGGLSIADPRIELRSGGMGVLPWDATAGTVSGESLPSNGKFAVADPRARSSFLGQGKYPVAPWDEASGTIIASSTTGHGAYAVADPRPAGLARGAGDPYLTAGHYGVVPWEEPSGAVSAAACHDNGRWAVADPRPPARTDRLVAVIEALDGTWHRPFTTLELAALQSLIDPDEMFSLEGASDQAHRERIGNAVPPDSAKAIAETMGLTLLLAWSGERFVLSDLDVWVQPVAIAISVADPSEA